MALKKSLDILILTVECRVTKKCCSTDITDFILKSAALKDATEIIPFKQVRG
jgi:hypothetical protein